MSRRGAFEESPEVPSTLPHTNLTFKYWPQIISVGNRLDRKDTAADSECTCGLLLYLFTGMEGGGAKMSKDKGVANNSTMQRNV